MPFEIVRNDIVNMRVDAIVNTANPRPQIGAGVDTAVHRKAGPELLAARKQIGDLKVGEAAVTPGFGLDANYVIHAVGPVWQGGEQGEVQLLRRCYASALHLAAEHGCESVAFPLISAGSYGFPKRVALRAAIDSFSDFLMDHDMQIYLVVFNREAVELSEKLFHNVASYIDEHYVQKKKLSEYGAADKRELDRQRMTRMQMALQYEEKRRQGKRRPEVRFTVDTAPTPQTPDLSQMLEEIDAGFSETLLKLIERTGRKESEIYKKANVDRKLFSKIRNNPDYKPSKSTALAFALALELDLNETREFIGRAGFALTHSSKFDIIVEFFIKEKNYDIFELNETLFAFDQPPIGV